MTKKYLLSLLLLASSCSDQSESNSFKIRIRPGGDAEKFLSDHKISTKSLTRDYLFYDAEVRNITGEHRDELAKLVHKEFGCGALLPASLNLISDLTTPEGPIYRTQVSLSKAKELIGKTSSTQLESTVKSLESISTRFHTSASGLAAPDTIKTMFSSANSNAQTALVTHSTTNQKSVVVTFPGASDDSTTVVVAAHLDSISSYGSTSPGADDDATGVATLIEMARAIKESGATFKRRVELHAYAGEEVGLLGSYDIARSYKNSGRKIAAMVQLDMNGYGKTTDKIYLVTNSTSSWLRRNLMDLSALYLDNAIEEKQLASGTSDHASWNSEGFHAVFPFEDPAAYNKLLHTPDDKSSALTFGYSEKFTKLGLAFLAHYAGLVSASSEYDSGLASLSSGIKSDVKFAFTKDSSSKWYISLASTTALSSVETCFMAAKTNAECKAERNLFSFAKTEGGRNFYVSQTSVALAEGDILRVRGYLSSGLLGFERNVSIRKK